jgi:hypothetical protein
MARDVAERELDQAGFRILNLGNPASAGDATKTDNTTVPQAASGAGSPGASLLAAPADHVHPAPAGGGPSAAIITLTSDRLQVTSGAGEEILVEWFPDFDALGSQRMIPEVAAFASGAGTLNLRVAGGPGAANGVVVATIDLPAAQAGIPRGVRGQGAPINIPSGVLSAVLTAIPADPSAPISVRAKVVTLKAA